MGRTQKRMTRGWLAFNVLGFQTVWFAWSWGAPAQHLGWPALASIVYVGLHLRFTPQRQRDLAAVALCIVGGVVFDTAMMQADWLRFASPNPAPPCLTGLGCAGSQGARDGSRARSIGAGP